jgi:hypothetical protein
MTDEDIVLNSAFLAEEEKQAEEGGGNPTDAGL